MGQPYKNNDIRTIIKNTCKLDQYTDKVPAVIDDKVSLVMNINPDHNRTISICKTSNCNNAVTTTMITTATNVDTYITGATLSVIKDVTSTSIASYINLVIDGTVAAVSLLSLPGITLTVQNQTASISLNNPIKLSRGSIVSVNNNTAVANIATTATIYGYTVDDRVYDVGYLAQLQSK